MTKKSKKIDMYEVSGDSIKRKNKQCPRCGPGIFMAEHSDRLACGKCGYTEIEKKSGQEKSEKKEGKPEKKEEKSEKSEEKESEEKEKVAPKEKEETKKPTKEKSEKTE